MRCSFSLKKTVINKFQTTYVVVVVVQSETRKNGPCHFTPLVHQYYNIAPSQLVILLWSLFALLSVLYKFRFVFLVFLCCVAYKLDGVLALAHFLCYVERFSSMAVQQMWCYFVDCLYVCIESLWEWLEIVEFSVFSVLFSPRKKLASQAQPSLNLLQLL